MAGEHPAPRGARVRGLAHRPAVGADGGTLLPQVSRQPDPTEGRSPPPRAPRRGLPGRGGWSKTQGRSWIRGCKWPRLYRPRAIGQGPALAPASHTHWDPAPRLRAGLTPGSEREGDGDERSWAGGEAALILDLAPPSRRKALPAEYRVRLGALHLGPSSPPALLAPVRRVLLPPDYSEDGAHGDLALLLLRRPTPLSTRVQPVCLPEPGARPPPGTPCWVTGWGSLRPGGEAEGRARGHWGRARGSLPSSL